MSTERDIQRETVAMLRKNNFTVIVTSQGRRSSNTPGTPDLFVWVNDRWIAFETKKPGGKVSKEQEKLYSERKSHIYTSVLEMKLFIGEQLSQ